MFLNLSFLDAHKLDVYSGPCGWVFFFPAINCSEIFGVMMYNLGLQGDTFDTQMSPRDGKF